MQSMPPATVVPALVRRLRNGSCTQQAEALRQLEALSINDGKAVGTALAACGGMRVLMRQLDSSGAAAAAVSVAACTVTNACSSPAGRDAAVAAGGLRRFTRLLSSADGTAQYAAASGLFNMIPDEEAADAAVAEGAVPALARVVREGDPKAHDFAALALAALAVEGGDRVAAAVGAADGAVAALVRLLHGSFDSEQAAAAAQERAVNALLRWVGGVGARWGKGCWGLECAGVLTCRPLCL